MGSSSYKVAFGGIACALSLLCMFLSGVFPMAEYTTPALAGIILVVLVIDFGKPAAWIAYGAVSLLSLFITPNKEAVILFIAFLGYYPILKSNLEQIKSRVLEWVLKMLVFNAACISAYFVIINLFGMTELITEMSMGLEYGIYLFLALANAVFVLYDIALSQVITFYFNVIRPKLRIK